MDADSWGIQVDLLPPTADIHDLTLFLIIVPIELEAFVHLSIGGGHFKWTDGNYAVVMTAGGTDDEKSGP